MSAAPRAVERLLILAGLVALSFVIGSRLEAEIYQTAQGWWLDHAAGSASGSAARDGSRWEPLGRILIPRIGLAAVVKEGVDAHSLLLAAGHLPGSASPGETGNVVIAGHRDSFFRPLRNVRVNDLIEISTPRGLFRYRVTAEKVVKPDRIDLLERTDLPTLTLVTCYPFTYIGSAPERFIVRARLLDRSAVAPDGTRAARVSRRPLPKTVVTHRDAGTPSTL